MNIAVVVGGSKGLGAAIVDTIKNLYKKIIIIDISDPLVKAQNIQFIKCNIARDDIPFDLSDKNIDALIITAAIGQVKEFYNISITEISKIVSINTVATIKIIKLFYSNLHSKQDKYCFVMGSIAGEVSSPLLSVYGASKAAIHKFCESINIELAKSGSYNRITCGIATSFSGTSFNGGQTDITQLRSAAAKCIDAMNKKQEIVYFDECLCKKIIDRYNSDKKAFGDSSYDYKIKNARINHKKSIIIGYLSGTFDLFHIGHLNLIKKAKEQCDYLIVGVHESGSWKGKETFIPFAERIEIVKNIRYVDEVCKSTKEDTDAWYVFHYDKLFVGSDYKGSERFKQYELFFRDKNVEIVYFPYTKQTSSSQIRELIKRKNK